MASISTANAVTGSRPGNRGRLSERFPGLLHPRVETLSRSPTLAINERSNELLRAGRNVYKMGLGQSPFPVPTSVVQALAAHAGEKDYLPVRGLPALAEAVADYHQRVDGLSFVPDNIIIGPGSKELIYNAQLCLRGETVLPSPCWVSYEPQARLAGRTVRWVHTRYDQRYRLQPKALDAHCRRHRAEARLLILNYPGNPDGLSYNAQELEALAEVLRRNEVIVISDEIYGPLHHSGEHVSLARFYPEGTIVSGGLSKWCGAGGWRIGTFALPSQLKWLVEAMTALASETYTAVAAPIQNAAVRAYEGGREINAYVEASRRIVAALGRRCAAIVRAAGMRVHDPAGGFYLFVDLDNHRSQLASRGIFDSATLCERLLEETGVAMLPGTVFGRPGSELSVRLAYVNFDGARALDLGQQHPSSKCLDDASVDAACPDTVAALKAFASFVCE